MIDRNWGLFVLAASVAACTPQADSDTSADDSSSSSSSSSSGAATTSSDPTTSGTTTAETTEGSTSSVTEATGGSTSSDETDGGSSTGGSAALCGNGSLDDGESCDDGGPTEECTADCYWVAQRLWEMEHDIEGYSLVALDVAATPNRVFAVGRLIPDEPAPWGGWTLVLTDDGEVVADPTLEHELYGAELYGVIAVDDDHVLAGTLEYAPYLSRGTDGDFDWTWSPPEIFGEAWDVARVGDELWVPGWTYEEGRNLGRFDLAGMPLSPISVDIGGSGNGTRLAAAAGVVAIEENPGVCKVSAAGELQWCDVPSEGLGRISNVAVASDGSIVVTAVTGDDSPQAFVQRYDADGGVAWSTPIGPGELQGLAVDPADNILVGGRDGVEEMGIVARLDLQTGEVQWRATDTDTTELFAIAVGETGRLTAVGTSNTGEAFVARYAY